MQKGSKSNPKGQEVKTSHDFRASTPALSPMKNNRGQLHSPNQSRMEDINGNAAARRPQPDQDVTLSPIAGSSVKNNCIDTILQDEGNAAAPDCMTVPRGRKMDGVNKSPYPFPKPPCMSLPVLDKYSSLVSSLEVLKLHDEEESLDEPSPNPKKGLKGITKAKKPMHKTFAFTQDMFKTGNSSSEAFIQVTHFLFEKLDKEATSARFRNAWPIYEKKQETLYRRAALEWFKELIAEHPNFFSRSVKVEQLQGLIVNPYGDRFIRFIHSFADFVMYTFTCRDHSLDVVVPLLDKFVPTGNPEVTRRQAKIVGSRIAVLDNLAFKVQKSIVKQKMQTRVQERKCNDAKKELQQELCQRKAELSNSIKTHPEIFPPDAANLLAEEEQYIKEELRSRAAVDRTKDVVTPLYKHVREERIRCCDELGRKVDILIAFFEKHSRLWTMLLLAKDKRMCLDFNRLCLPSASRDDIPTFDHVIEHYAFIANTAFSKINSLEISPDLRRRLDHIKLRLSIIQQKQTGIAGMTGVRTPDYQTRIDYEMKRLGIMLESVDWSRYTNIHVAPLSSMFNFSPPRSVDGSRATGLTPAISTYLPAIEFSKVNEAKTMDKTEIQQPLLLGNGRGNINSSLNANKILSSSHGDTCDSPVSHLPFKGTMEPTVLIQSRSSSRRNSLIGKFRLSLPPPKEEIDECPKEEIPASFPVSIVSTGDRNLPVNSNNSILGGNSNVSFQIGNSNASKYSNNIVPVPCRNTNNRVPHENINKLSPNGNNNNHCPVNGNSISVTNVQEPSSSNGANISSKERMEQLWQHFADAKAETPAPVQSLATQRRRTSKRRSSLQSVKNARDVCSNPNQSFSPTQDLEDKLGIMDVSLSMADLLDVTYDEEDSLTE